MSTLTEFQGSAGRALNDPSLPSPGNISEKERDGSSRRFAIYRNNRANSLIDALQSTYPVLYQLTGETFFHAAARQFIDASPPSSPVLTEYGEPFGKFMQDLPGAAAFPYLADMGRLEWCRMRAYHASDEPVLPLASLQEYSSEALLNTRFKLHDAAALVQSDWAIGSLWHTIANPDTPEFDISQAQSVLISRIDLNVQMQLLTSDGTQFLQQLMQGFTIAEAATHCLTINADFDTGTHLQGLISSAAFTTITN